MIPPETVTPAVTVGTHLTATEIILIISAVSGAITTIIGVWRNGTKTDKVISAVVGTDDKPGLVKEVSKIHELTNNTLSQTKNELIASQALTASLKEMIMELKAERDKKAMHDAYAAVPGAATGAAPVTPAVPDTVTLTAPAPVVAALAEAVAAKVITPVTTEIKKSAEELAELAREELKKFQEKK